MLRNILELPPASAADVRALASELAIDPNVVALQSLRLGLNLAADTIFSATDYAVHYMLPSGLVDRQAVDFRQPSDIDPTVPAVHKFGIFDELYQQADFTATMLGTSLLNFACHSLHHRWLWAGTRRAGGTVYIVNKTDNELYEGDDNLLYRVKGAF